MPYPYPLEDFAGRRFGRLVVVELLPYAGPGKGRLWRCQCDCGNEHTASSGNLRKGHIASCGCLYRESIGNRSRTHGKRQSVEYRCWTHIKTRCCNPRSKSYPNYGGRGISVCPEWLSSFETFYSDMGPRPSGKDSIERIDNNGNYEPSNCRWATSQEQRANQRQRRITYRITLTHNDETLPLPEWSERTGISIDSIRARLKMGWSVEDALTRPLRKDRRRAGSVV